jgi:hypothetical protein
MVHTHVVSRETEQSPPVHLAGDLVRGESVPSVKVKQSPKAFMIDRQTAPRRCDDGVISGPDWSVCDAFLMPSRTKGSVFYLGRPLGASVDFP